MLEKKLKKEKIKKEKNNIKINLINKTYQ